MKRNVKRHAVVQPLDQSIKLIPLTQGQNAIVDSSDYEWLMQWNWYARWNEKTQSFYAGRKVWGQDRIIKMHRVILGLNDNDGREGDHINCNTLDSRRSNLRIATHPQNCRNRGMNKNNKCGVKGVSWDRGRWVARITFQGISKNLGRFFTIDAARNAYNEAAHRLFGEFARSA